MHSRFVGAFRRFSTQLPKSRRASVYYNDPNLWTGTDNNFELCSLIEREHSWFPFHTFDSLIEAKASLRTLQEKGYLLLGSQGSTTSWNFHLSRTKMLNPQALEDKDSPFLKELFAKLNVVLPWTRNESEILYHQLRHHLNDSECKQKLWKMVRIIPCDTTRKDCHEWELAILVLSMKKKWLNRCERIEAETLQTTVAVPRKLQL